MKMLPPVVGYFEIPQDVKLCQQDLTLKEAVLFIDSAAFHPTASQHQPFLSGRVLRTLWGTSTRTQMVHLVLWSVAREPDHILPAIDRSGQSASSDLPAKHQELSGLSLVGVPVLSNCHREWFLIPARGHARSIARTRPSFDRAQRSTVAGVDNIHSESRLIVQAILTG